MRQPDRVLVVDDREVNRDALSRLLMRKGFVVALACDGPESLQLVGTQAFDLVLLDVEMPGMSGLEVLGRIRETCTPTELPVIMVTARTQGADIVEAFRLGANDYVTKPVDFPVALARIRTHLAHKGTVADLRESEERYALAAQGANDGLWDWNLVSNEVYWSSRWKAMLGYADAEIGVTADEWLARVHESDLAAVKGALAAHLAGPDILFQHEHRIRHRNGLFRWMLCRAAAVRDSQGTVTRLAGSLTDVTDARVADTLTGLPNRLLLVELLDRAITHAQRHPDETFAVLQLALSGVRAVTHGLGPITADRLLVAVGERLQASLQQVAADTDGLRATLARLEGDEFAVLLEHVTHLNQPSRVAERLQSALGEPFEVDSHQVFTSVAVGMTVSTTGYRRPGDVLQDASIALHRAKRDEAVPIEHFDPAMRERAIARLRLETDLRQAIERSEFEVYYQPIVALASGRIHAFEALARWRHPIRGIVGPGEFIPVAEETGIIRSLGRQMLLDACRRMAAWLQRFGADAPAMMSVNVSARQLTQIDLRADVESVLHETGLPAARLKLEITESSFINDAGAAEIALRRLREIGVAWSLDDFGTGYSSLSYLHRLQAQTLKIDRSFVTRMGADRSGSEMVRAIVAIAHTLGMDVVAEGVETTEQRTELRMLGCEYAQGFYFAQPVDAARAEIFLSAQPWLDSPVAGPTDSAARPVTCPRENAGAMQALARDTDAEAA